MQFLNCIIDNLTILLLTINNSKSKQSVLKYNACVIQPVAINVCSYLENPKSKQRAREHQRVDG